MRIPSTVANTIACIRLLQGPSFTAHAKVPWRHGDCLQTTTTEPSRLYLRALIMYQLRLLAPPNLRVAYRVLGWRYGPEPKDRRTEW
jgi:hypothetical protein